MTAYVNMGDKVSAGTSVAGAITLNNQQNIFTSDAVIPITTGKVFTVTSPLIDANTIPVVSCIPASGDTGGAVATYLGKIVPTTWTLNSQGFAAVATPGTLTFTLVALTNPTSAAPKVGVNFL
jgi:hypothetical protein